jgi:hypothetical protein
LFRFSAPQSGGKTQQSIHKTPYSEPFEFSFEMASLVPFCIREARRAPATKMNARNIFCWLVAFCCLSAAIYVTCGAQSPPPENKQDPKRAEKMESMRADNLTESKDSSGVWLPEAAPENDLGLALLKNLVNDQKAIWTSPAHLRLGDATWLVPFAGLTAGFLVTDQDASSHLSHTPSTLRHYTSFSNYGLAGMVGAGAGLYFLGKSPMTSTNARLDS